MSPREGVHSAPVGRGASPATLPRLVSSPAPARRAWVEQVMGLPVSIHLRGDEAVVGSDAARRAVGAAFGLLTELDRIFSPYRDDSDLLRLRREELDLEACSPLVREALALGAEAEHVTEGAFTTMLPTGSGELAFDPTGLVKGWSVDLAAEALRELPRTSFCVNAGGDLLVGAHRDVPLLGAGAISWRVGIEDPRDRARVASTLALTHGAVATSGTAARGAHLYDPRTGSMVERPGSVTVVGPSLLWADVWATALFVGDGQTREAFALSAPDYLSSVL